MEGSDWARLLGGIGSGVRVSRSDVHTMEDTGLADSTSSGDGPVRISADRELLPRAQRSAGGRKRESFGPPAPAVEEGGGPLVDLVGSAAKGGVCGGTEGRPAQGEAPDGAEVSR